MERFRLRFNITTTSILDDDNYVIYTDRFQGNLNGVDGGNKASAIIRMTRTYHLPNGRSFTHTPVYSLPSEPSGLVAIHSRWITQAIYANLAERFVPSNSFSYSDLQGFAVSPSAWQKTKQYHVGDVVTFDPTILTIRVARASIIGFVLLSKEPMVWHARFYDPPIGTPPNAMVTLDVDVTSQDIYYWQPILPSLQDYFRCSYIPFSAAEIRAETWDCLTWGAKGILI